MARLNEAPLPTESIDALKRRFVRQNRELAKNNSAQCLRIRSLECEVSRLLADNLNLREEVLRLRSELPAASTQPRVDFSALAAVKDQLEAKLLDFGSLVAELGTLQNAASQAMERREPDPASWRPEVPMAALSGQAQRLSIVGEEKASPGGTLYADVIRPRLEDHSNESPELGPPPIAHFDCDDPIKFDPKPSVSDGPVDDVDVSDSDYVPASLSVNLQTRRRRRETCFEQDMKSVPSSSSTTDADAEAESITEESRRPNKASTKRRLSMRDASEIDTVPIKDDFVFSRRTSIGMEPRKSTIDTDERQAELPDTTEKSDLNKVPSLAPRTERKVLGDKSVNMSPQKRTASQISKDGLSKPEKPAKESTRGSARERKPRNSFVKPLSVPTEPLVDTIDFSAAETRKGSETLSRPKTPVPDVLSPTPEESATRLDGRDTPPPSAFNSAKTMVSAEINGASRPSRRARAAVNYAEPNLVSKMRRPDKTLSDAVTLNGRRSMSNPPGSEVKQGSRTVVIKREESDDSAWNALARSHEPEHIEAGSPLGVKSAAMRQDDGERVKPRASASGRAIAALMATKPDLKRRRDEEEKEMERETETEKGKEAEARIEETSKKMQEMDMYDFKDSSPRPAEEEKKISRRRSNVGGSSSSQEAPKRRVSRVQRQVPAETSTEDQAAEGEAPKKPERLMARRRSMMV